MILLSERVVLIHIKDRRLKAKLPDIDKVELFTIQMGHSTYDQKVAYLKQQMKETSISADQFRSYWKHHCGGTTTKRGAYITRPDIIDLLAHRVITQHGGFGQDTARDRRH
eukprot:6379245-Karenia_brevis.AAC.1